MKVSIFRGKLAFSPRMNGKSKHKSGYGDSVAPRGKGAVKGLVRYDPTGVRWHLVDIFHLRSTGPHLGQRAEGRLGKLSAPSAPLRTAPIGWPLLVYFEYPSGAFCRCFSAFGPLGRRKERAKGKPPSPLLWTGEPSEDSFGPSGKEAKRPEGLLHPDGGKTKGQKAQGALRAERSAQAHRTSYRYRKHCYGEIGRHTGLRGLGLAGRLGSNPSSNNFLHIFFPKHRYGMPIRLGRRSVFFSAYLAEGLGPAFPLRGKRLAPLP